MKNKEEIEIETELWKFVIARPVGILKTTVRIFDIVQLRSDPWILLV